jgi:integrase/recombinase XerD
MADVESIDQLLDLWLHGKSRQSQRAYRTDVAHFLAFCDGKPLQRVTLNDVQAFSTALEKQGYSSATQNRRLSAVKSLLAFGHKIGYLPFDVGAPVEAPPVKNRLAERILSELEVMTMIALESNHRNKLLIRFLYLSGARVSEAAELRWRDLKSVGDRGQVTLFGKGGKIRILALPPDLFKQLMAFRKDAPADAPVFASRQGGSVKPNQIRNIIARAGKRAGIEGNVSPHWLRSHSFYWFS